MGNIVDKWLYQTFREKRILSIMYAIMGIDSINCKDIHTPKLAALSLNRAPLKIRHTGEGRITWSVLNAHKLCFMVNFQCAPTTRVKIGLIAEYWEVPRFIPI